MCKVSWTLSSTYIYWNSFSEFHHLLKVSPKELCLSTHLDVPVKHVLSSTVKNYLHTYIKTHVVPAPSLSAVSNQKFIPCLNQKRLDLELCILILDWYPWLFSSSIINSFQQQISPDFDFESYFETILDNEKFARSFHATDWWIKGSEFDHSALQSTLAIMELIGFQSNFQFYGFHLVKYLIILIFR